MTALANTSESPAAESREPVDQLGGVGKTQARNQVVALQDVILILRKRRF